MRVAIVAEYYPRAADPVLGVWAHRQALAARDAGADVRVLVLHRPVPVAGRAARAATRRRCVAPLRQPLRAELDGIEVRYVPFARPAAAAHLRALGRVGGAVAARSRCGGCGASSPTTSSTPTTPRPAGDAVRRARPGAPYVVSVHGGDVLSVARRLAGGARAVRARRSAARGSCSPTRAAIERARPRARRARDTRVVHLGTDLPAQRARGRRRGARSSPSPTSSRASATPTCCARCGCCATRTRRCAGSWSATGPERAGAGAARRRARARRPRATSRGALPPAEAVARRAARRGRSCCPSVDEAFGVAYVEAMAGGVPGDRLPRRAGAGGDRRRRRRDPARRRPATRRRSPRELGALLDEPALAARARRARRAPPSRRAFTWARCGARDGGGLRGGAAVSDPRPVLFVTNHAPPFRVGAFAALHEREDVVFALIGGGVRHGGGARARGRRAAVPRACAPTPARRARGSPPPAASAPWSPGSPAASRCPPRRPARAAPRVPFVLWATIWAHPRTPAHALSYLPLRAPLPRRRRGRRPTARTSRAYVRAQGRPRAGLRGAPERRRRVLGGAARRPSGAPRSRRCLPAD